MDPDTVKEEADERQVDRSHDPARESWVESAQGPDTDFPVQNLPFAVYREGGGGRIGVAIGERLLDLGKAVEDGFLDTLDLVERDALAGDSLNGYMALPSAARQRIRLRLSDLLSTDVGEGEKEGLRAALRPLQQIEFALPARVGDYTDFYASIDHARRIGSLFRPDNPLLPNYGWIPIGYHGRASSLLIDGTPIRRPAGQGRPDSEGGHPGFGASRRLDYEVEVGVWIGPGNEIGEPIPIGKAEEHFVGISLLNDWSARDLQAWEYQPLGPFLGKSFATSLSPWVVTVEALAPFRVPARPRAEGEPHPLPYLDPDPAATPPGIALTVEVSIRTEAMRKANLPHERLSEGSLAGLFWTIPQMITHHASNGCNLRPGDLLGSGTVSGPTDGERGCLLEITGGGREAIRLPSGEERTFLEDGDEVRMRGFCAGSEHTRRIGLGTCSGTILPATNRE